MRGDVTSNRELVTGAARSLCVLRWELVYLVVLAAVFWMAATHLGGQLAALAGAAVLAVVVSVPWSRREAWWLVRKWHTRRWWRYAISQTRLAINERAPKLRQIVRVPAGKQLRVRLLIGQAVEDYQREASMIASSAGCIEVRVARERSAKYVRLTLVNRDPLDCPAIPWPLAAPSPRSLWQPIPVAVDEDGGWRHLHLPECNLLVGGEPGGGKSAALSMVAATGALDPDVRLWLMDGKLVELAAWAPCADGTAGADLGEAIELLEELRRVMDERYRHLLAHGLRKVGPEDGFPLHLVICDELAFYLTAPDKKQRDRLTNLLRDIVARGRAAGVIVCAATQKPAADVVPSSLRDLFGLRWAMRCNTPQASDTILGQGWASEGFSAARIAPGHRGVGYLLDEEGLPVRCRAAYVPDHELRELAHHAAQQRNVLNVLPEGPAA